MYAAYQFTQTAEFHELDSRISRCTVFRIPELRRCSSCEGSTATTDFPVFYEINLILYGIDCSRIRIIIGIMPYQSSQSYFIFNYDVNQAHFQFIMDQQLQFHQQMSVLEPSQNFLSSE
ncbi:hypothetical protein V1477_007146 [Vespula maculifrons]|uniref:Uncharacterized protein n=1 Tax=Vespula maculifrons TaxID=7453 RepID=A0ABD2CIC5_VESMC